MPSTREGQSIGDNNTNYSPSRSWARFPIHTRITITYSRSGQPTFVQGQGGDICEGGMSLFIPVDLELGQELRLSFQMPYRSSPVQLKAVVRNRARFRYGVEFADMTSEQRETVVAACKALALMQ